MRINHQTATRLVQRVIRMLQRLKHTFTHAGFEEEWESAMSSCIDLAALLGAPAVPLRGEDIEHEIEVAAEEFSDRIARILDRPHRRRKSSCCAKSAMP